MAGAATSRIGSAGDKQPEEGGARRFLERSVCPVRLCRQHGVELLRLPPYHCHFNPIELAWADLKSYVRANNFHPDKPATVGGVIIDAIRYVDGEIPLKDIPVYACKAKWPSYVRRVMKMEEEAKLKECLIVHDSLRGIFVNCDNSDSGSDSECDD